MNQRTLLNFFALMIMKSKCNIRFAVIHGDRSNLLHEGHSCLEATSTSVANTFPSTVLERDLVILIHASSGKNLKNLDTSNSSASFLDL